MRKPTFTKLFRLVGVGCALLLPILVWADTAPLVGDAYINPGDGSNYGGLPVINVGGAGSQGLLLFDVSGIPVGSGVTYARLRFYVDSVVTAGAVDLYTASSAWSEASVSGTSGVGPGSLVAGGITVAGPGYVTVDVTAQAQLWINGAANTGFLLNANPGTTSIVIDSKENVATSHPAVLEIVLVGPAGPTGLQGAAGNAGPTGPTGTTGLLGPTGPNAPTGATGAAGITGPTGPSGPLGNTGAVGSAGAQGNKGVTGSTGPTGPAGATGSVGSAGAVGANGPPGPNGNTGPTGPAGNTGAQGVTGNTGSTGNQGALGATGPQGNSGSTGAVGNTGANGSQGGQGSVGAQGAVGVTGPTFSNTFDSTVIAGGTTISDSATQHVFFVTNSSAVTIVMPHANVAGKFIRIVGTQGSNTITINTASGSPRDQFLTCCSGSVTTDSTVRGKAYVSDGAGNWYTAEVN